MSSKLKAKNFLKRLFAYNAYRRFPNPARRKRDGQKYKKGYEVRLVVDSMEQLRKTQRALAETGFISGKAFRKHSRFVVPIYGKEQVKRFSTLFKLPKRKKPARKEKKTV